MNLEDWIYEYIGNIECTNSKNLSWFLYLLDICLLTEKQNKPLFNLVAYWSKIWGNIWDLWPSPLHTKLVINLETKKMLAWIRSSLSALVFKFLLFLFTVTICFLFRKKQSYIEINSNENNSLICWESSGLLKTQGKKFARFDFQRMK